jgi:hypothetical protein
MARTIDNQMDNPSVFHRLLLDFLHEQLPSRDG